VVGLRPARLRRAPIDNPRFIEVDMRLDQTGATKEPRGIMAGCICRDRGLDGGDATICDAYIDGSVFRPGQAGVGNYKIQHRCHPLASGGVGIAHVFVFAKDGAALLDLEMPAKP